MDIDLGDDSDVVGANIRWVATDIVDVFAQTFENIGADGSIGLIIPHLPCLFELIMKNYGTA
ncbi:hypothetical protein [Niveispirillum sp.]|uniref:hypothetical protein n=1 Tax=Niveispirillum sp. TaxID=1917217 RepID=UPI001B747804|nr:hypothetical protein [Niveispirillum sp.]MBP7337824.1 hypothetical protein [Niveispirillum sp.]